MEEWEIVKSDTFNRKLIVTKSTRRFVANFINDEEAEYICALHNASISKTIEDKCAALALDLRRVRCTKSINLLIRMILARLFK